MNGKCKICNKESMLKLAIVRVLTSRGWIEEKLKMCPKCIKEENAVLDKAA